MSKYEVEVTMHLTLLVDAEDLDTAATLAHTRIIEALEETRMVLGHTMDITTVMPAK